MGRFERRIRRSRDPHRLARLVAALALAGTSGCVGGTARETTPSGTWKEAACDLPPEWVGHIARGTQTGGGRDTDLIVVHRPPHYIGTSTDAGHSGPFEHLQDIPLVFYGPGHIRARGEVPEPATLASVAPTFARLLDFNLPGADEPALKSALVPSQARPRLIVTAVIDGGGWNALNRWPSAWPHIGKLMEKGTSFPNATVGSSPSITPAAHSSLGTGVYPRTHGVTGVMVRDGGRVTGAFTPGLQPTDFVTDPTLALEHPTLAELYDRAENNAPKVALIGFGNYVLGMIGRGAGFPGGDKDIAMYSENDRWISASKYYTLPAYVRGRDEHTDEDLEEVDRIDGVVDGMWRGHTMDPVTATPAFTARLERTVRSIIVHEDMGADDVPDMLFVNFKAPDEAGHLWNMTSPELKDALASVDEAIGTLTKRLDDLVGRGKWVLALTADHGQTPIANDAWTISMLELRNDIAATFDHVDNKNGLFDRSSHALLFVNRKELETNELTPEQLASFISEYTVEENVVEGELTGFWEERAEERLFTAAFPVRRLDEVVACVRASNMRADGS
jgi:Type I phosphodiesterase / nucleotide pyrophosphatase